ncbi:MAG: hypothetical protein IT362_00785 [Deltaproteobacteria bacterium]|nr:hypothetical protein [Deltaproteobacteria bacterium]
MDEFLQRIDKKISILKQELAQCENARMVYLREMRGQTSKETEPVPALFPFEPDNSQIKPLSKKDQIIKLLKEHGPLSRKQIAEMTGFKHGTLAFTLSGNKNTFVSKDGLWHLTE